MNPDLLNPLPHDPIALITERFGLCLLIGAHARDHVVVTKAGLQGSRLTRDLDFAVAVPSLEVYSEKTAALESSTGVATRFHVAGVPVDLIPFHPEGTDNPLVEVSDGIVTDISGLDEAFATGEPFPAHPLLRVPTLHALLVLKAVAWRMRGSGASNSKDATDLALLLDCLDEGDYEDRWQGADDTVLERYEFDTDAISAHLTGEAAARDLPVATESVLSVWRDERLPLAASRFPTERVRYRRALLALASGAEEALVTT